MGLSVTKHPSVRAEGENGGGLGAAGLARILVVDDDPDVRESAGLVLKLEGYQVLLADRTAKALDAVESFRPHLALVDIGLAGESGYDLARRIRELPLGKDIVLIAMSGYGDSPQSRACGFDLHLTKPVDPEALLALVREKAATRSR